MLVQRRRLAEDDVADRQRDRRGADAGGERQDRDERRHGVAPHVARGAAEVLHEVIEPEQAPGLVEALAGDGHVAEPPARRDARRVRRHPLIDEPLGLDLDVGADFAVEVVV